MITERMRRADWHHAGIAQQRWTARLAAKPNTPSSVPELFEGRDVTVELAVALRPTQHAAQVRHYPNSDAPDDRAYLRLMLTAEIQEVP